MSVDNPTNAHAAPARPASSVDVLEEHHVTLDAFEGPLDLLLFLIRKNEVDVHDIPVASITEQYLRHLEALSAPGAAHKIDIDLAGEFLVMAATLMEIKSRMLNPKPAQARAGADSGPAEDPRAELVRQLLVYKQFRDAADALEQRALDWSRRFPAGPALADSESIKEAIEGLRDEEAELDEIQIVDLVEAFRKVAETVNFERLGEHKVTYDDIPVELHAEDIVDRLKRHALGDDLDAITLSPAAGLAKNEMDFRSIFTGRTRPEMVGLFLAMLQLCRQQRITFRVDRENERLLLRLAENPEQQPVSVSPPPTIAPD